jgi:hypothetical protein
MLNRYDVKVRIGKQHTARGSCRRHQAGCHTYTAVCDHVCYQGHTGIIDREQDCDILIKGGMNMKYLFVCGILCLLAVCGQPAHDVGAIDLTRQAKDFVELLVQGDYAGVVNRFDGKMQEVLPEKQVEETWSALQDRFGHFQKQIGVRQTKEHGFDCVYVTCSFEKKNIDIKVVYNNEQKVAGLWFN